MKKEKLIITMEVEDWPDDALVVDIRATVMEDGWITKIFRNWKRVTYRPCVITNMEVNKD